MARIPEYPPLETGDLRRDYLNLREYLMRMIMQLQDSMLSEAAEAAKAAAEAAVANIAPENGSSGGNSGGNSEITVDAAMSSTSTNPVQNRVIADALSSKAERSEIPQISGVPTNLSAFTDDLGSNPVHTHSQYLTQHQSLAGYVRSSDLAAVASTGNYDDLNNKPTIPTLPTLADVATSGDYDDLSNKPNLNLYVQTNDSRLSDARTPTAHTHDDRYYTESEVNDLLNDKMDEPAADGTAGQVLATDGAGGKYWKTVESGGGGSSGTDDYDELNNKPRINNTTLSGNKTLSQLGIAAENHTHTVNQITNFPTLAAVASSGSYNDLSDKPAIPTLPTLADVATSGDYDDLNNKPTIPVLPTLAAVATSGSYNDLSDKPTIPTVPILATVATSGDYDDLSNKPSIPTIPTLAAVAISGSYNDLTDKPAIPEFRVIDYYSTTLSVPANGGVASSLLVNPEGYTPIGIVGFYSSHSSVVPSQLYISGTRAVYNLKNTSSSAISSFFIIIYVLFKKD